MSRPGPNLDPPKLDVFLTTEPLPPCYAWREVHSRAYAGARSTPEERAAAIRAAGHRIVPGPQARPVPAEPVPLRSALPPVTAEAIRDAGMIVVEEATGRSAHGETSMKRLASPAFPDLEKRIETGPAAPRRVSFSVAGKEVRADPATIIAALEALGARRKPPMRQRT